MNSIQQEGKVLGRYLLGGKEPSATSLELYRKFVELRGSNFPGKEKKIFSFAIRNRWAMGMIDGALAFSAPQSMLRKRLLAMSAILETQPEYASLFLPERRSWFYNIYIFWVGTRAVLKSIGGRILLLFI